MILAIRLRGIGARRHAGEQPQDQEIRRLERRDGDIVEILIAIHHVAANHGAKLQDRYSQLLGSLRFRVLAFGRPATNLHAHKRIVGGRSGVPN
jgi:hypothetical protein